MPHFHLTRSIAMFCSQCGVETTQKTAKFCFNCGFQFSNTNTNSTCGFIEFKRRKEEERRSKFEPKGKKAKSHATSTSSAPTRKKKDVVINVGVMKYFNGELKKCRGKTLPITTTPEASSEEIKEKAVSKHTNHDKTLHYGFDYVLLYPDGSEIVNIPGSTEPFVLEKYREEVGRPYNRITLFICTKTDMLFSEMPSKTVLDNESESLEIISDSDDEELMKSIYDSSNQECKSSKSESTKSCAICLEKIAVDEIASKPNKCEDIFHDMCLKEWLVTCNSEAKCPTCQKVFTATVSVSLARTSNGSSSSQSNACEINQAQPSSNLDYMHLQRQYGDILYDSDESDQEETQGFIHAETETAATTTTSTTFSEDLEAFCESKAKELEERSYIRFKVRRNSLWQDVKFKCDRIKKEDIEENSYVKVQFVGEAGVDQGGPKREFFSLIHKEVSSSSLFVGEEGNGKTFAHNLVALQQNEYFKYGLCSGLAVLNGSVGPQFFCPPVVDYLLHGDVKYVKCSVDSIPNKPIKEKLKELECIKEPKLFEEKVISYFGESLHEMGYTKAVVFSDKNEFLRAATIHYTLSHCLCEMNQFIDGLNVTGVLHILRNHPFEAREVFQYSTCTLTAEILDGLFNAPLSPEGSNKNAKEKTILFYWNQFLEDVEQGLVNSEVYDYKIDSNVTVNISLEAVLAFITGSRSIPPLGLHPKPSIVFIHEGNRKMYVSTCSNVLYIPVTDYFLSFGTFKEEFTFCMLNSPGFGNV